MTKISELEAPILAGVVKERSEKGAIASIKNCACDGATMIDLHLSCLAETAEESLKRIVAASPIPILALNYNNSYEGSDAGFSEEDRVASMLRAIDAGAAGMDMQGYTFDPVSRHGFVGEDKYSFTKNSPKEVVTDSAVIEKQCELIETVHSKGAEVLLSCHPGIFMNRDQVIELALFLEKRSPDIIKIVTVANNSDELDECIKAMLDLKKEVKTPVSFHASGKAGIPSRIINPILGGRIAFCVDRYNERSAMDQPMLRTVSEILERMKRIR